MLSLLIMLFAVQSAPQSATIRIRVLDGHTAKPIIHAGVFVRVEPIRQRGIQNVPLTDQNGSITFAVDPEQRINAIVGPYPTCRRVPKADRSKGVIAFPVNQILATGFVESNSCSRRTVPQTPGELTLFVRQLHWWERLSD